MSARLAFVVAHGDAPDGDASHGEEPQSGWSHFVRWAGHFHPAMTAFPIALLLAAALAELFRVVTKAGWLEGAARFCVIVAAAGAAIAAPLGWAFAIDRGHSWILETHRWLGTTGAVWLVLLLVVSEVSRRRQGGWRKAYFAALFFAVPAVAATGFFGGAMVYGIHAYAWKSDDQSSDQSAPTTAPAGASGGMATHPTTGPGVTIVNMTDDATFRPAKIAIPAGSVVRWVNSSRDAHSVTADPRHASDAKDVSLPAGAAPFDSGKVSPGGAFEHRFDVPGTYKYVCVPHEDMSMTGEVVVTAPPPPP